MISVTTVVNIKASKCTVYIGRSGKGKTSIWGNPYIIGMSIPGVTTKATRKQVIDQYEKLMIARINRDAGYWLTELKKLKGHTLGCFCKPHACHGDVLVRLIKYYYPD